MIRKLIERWQRNRVLRALRIIANTNSDVVGYFSLNKRGVLVMSGDAETLLRKIL